MQAQISHQAKLLVAMDAQQEALRIKVQAWAAKNEQPELDHTKLVLPEEGATSLLAVGIQPEVALKDPSTMQGMRPETIVAETRVSATEGNQTARSQPLAVTEAPVAASVENELHKLDAQGAGSGQATEATETVAGAGSRDLVTSELGTDGERLPTKAAAAVRGKTRVEEEVQQLEQDLEARDSEIIGLKRAQAEMAERIYYQKQAETLAQTQRYSMSQTSASVGHAPKSPMRHTSVASVSTPKIHTVDYEHASKSPTKRGFAWVDRDARMNIGELQLVDAARTPTTKASGTRRRDSTSSRESREDALLSRVGGVSRSTPRSKATKKQEEKKKEEKRKSLTQAGMLSRVDSYWSNQYSGRSSDGEPGATLKLNEDALYAKTAKYWSMSPSPCKTER